MDLIQNVIRTQCAFDEVFIFMSNVKTALHNWMLLLKLGLLLLLKMNMQYNFRNNNIVNIYIQCVPYDYTFWTLIPLNLFLNVQSLLHVYCQDDIMRLVNTNDPMILPKLKQCIYDSHTHKNYQASNPTNICLDGVWCWISVSHFLKISKQKKTVPSKQTNENKTKQKHKIQNTKHKTKQNKSK